MVAPMPVPAAVIITLRLALIGRRSFSSRAFGSLQRGGWRPHPFVLAGKGEAGTDLVALQELQQVDQDLVALGLDLGDRAARGLGFAALDQPPLQLVAPFGVAEVGPGQLEARIELAD